MSKGFFKGDIRAVIAGQRAGVKSGEARRKARERRWKGLGIDPVVGQQIRWQGYQAGFARGYKAGLRKAQGQ